MILLLSKPVSGCTKISCVGSDLACISVRHAAHEALRGLT
jgi:hypothetical protein